MQSEKLLTTWTSLKNKLLKLTPLNKHKGLIKDAIELHLNQSSYLTTYHSVPAFMKHSGDVYNQQGFLDNPIPQTPRKSSHSRLDKNDPIWYEFDRKFQINVFITQQKKNQQIVKECKEVLGKL